MSSEKTSESAPVHAVVMRPEWLLAIAKAASSIRFTANNWEWVTESAKQESIKIADTLTEIENAIHHKYATSKIMATEQGHIAEEAFYDVDGNMIGYWAYGHYDPAYPFQG
jgi:hypothetical protein